MKIRDMYRVILAEMQPEGDGAHPPSFTGISPDKFVTARLPDEILRALNEPETTIFIHCNHQPTELQRRIEEHSVAQALAAKERREIAPCKAAYVPYGEADGKPLQSGRDDFPVKVIRSESAIHFVDLDGDTWLKQLLYVFAQRRVPIERLEDTTVNCGLEERMRAEAMKLLGAQKGCTGIESLTIGSKGLIPQAIERSAAQTASRQEAVARLQVESASASIEERVKGGREFSADEFVRKGLDQAQQRLGMKAFLAGKLVDLMPLHGTGTFAEPQVPIEPSDRQLTASEIELGELRLRAAALAVELLGNAHPRLDTLLVRTPEWSGQGARPAKVGVEKLFAELQKKRGYALDISGGIGNCRTLQDFLVEIARCESKGAGWDRVQEELGSVEKSARAISTMRGAEAIARSSMGREFGFALVAADPEPTNELQRRMTAAKESSAIAVEQRRAVLEDPRLSADPVVRQRLEYEPPPGKLGKLVPEFPKSTQQPLAMVCQAQAKCHVLVSVGDAHGDISYHLVREALRKKPDLQINFFGTCGSFDESRYPVASFVAPAGIITDAEPPPTPRTVACPNNVKIAPETAKASTHLNVCTLLQEHDAAVAGWKTGHGTVDMEVYHVCRAVHDHCAEEADRKVDLRIVLRVSDIVGSEVHGAQSDELRLMRDPAFNARMDKVVQAFGMIDLSK